MTSKEDQILSRLQAQCVRREYCVRDIFQKALKAHEGDEQAAHKTVERLVADRFVDDLRYATAFARDKAQLNGWGRIKISMMLSAKGISRENINLALDEVEPDKADARLRAVLQARYRTLRGDPQLRLKMLRYGMTRGYDYETVAAALEQIENSDSED